jgi:hypothetical protein
VAAWLHYSDTPLLQHAGKWYWYIGEKHTSLFTLISTLGKSILQSTILNGEIDWLLEKVEIGGAKDEKDPKDIKVRKLQKAVVV